jgi:hypothetical protein
MSALIDTHTRQLHAQLRGATPRGEAGEPTPQSRHLRRTVEPEEPAHRSWVFLLELLRTLDAQQRHKHERQQRRAQAPPATTDSNR